MPLKKVNIEGKRHQNYWQYFLGVPNRGVISFSIIFVALSLQKLFGLLHNDMIEAAFEINLVLSVFQVTINVVN